MLSNSEIVDIHLRSGLLAKCVRFQAQYAGIFRNREDILQDLCVLLLQYDNGRMNQMHRDGRINAFVTQVLRRELRCRNSRYNHLYKRYDTRRCDMDMAIC